MTQISDAYARHAIISGITGSGNTGLAASTTYKMKVALGTAAAFTLDVTTLTGTITYTNLVTAINLAFTNASKSAKAMIVGTTLYLVHTSATASFVQASIPTGTGLFETLTGWTGYVAVDDPLEGTVSLSADHGAQSSSGSIASNEGTLEDFFDMRLPYEADGRLLSVAYARSKLGSVSLLGLSLETFGRRF
jgi:hypothetical protein